MFRRKDPLASDLGLALEYHADAPLVDRNEGGNVGAAQRNSRGVGTLQPAKHLS
jgi:hypothetical protein